MSVCTAGLDFQLELLSLEFKLRINYLDKRSLTVTLPLIWNLCSNSAYLLEMLSLKAAGDKMVKFLF